MKIIKQANETKNNITAVSGSTSTPIESVPVPTGSHGMLEAITFSSCPKCSVPSALKKMLKLQIHESPMPTNATVWLRTLSLFVNNTIKKKASKGGTGMSQVRRSEVIGAPSHGSLVTHHRMPDE